MKKVKAKPFLKWAGGKGQLLGQFDDYFPFAMRNGNIDKYIEPFIGGGAVFFEVMQKFNIQSAYISDINKDLILAYLVIQQKPEILLDFLDEYQKDFDSTPDAEKNNLFMSIREHFNAQRFEINYKKLSDNWIPRAAQLIFLNKTCFNGLYRLNSKGGFNVPFGKYKVANILDEVNILAVSELLQKTEIRMANYDKCVEKIDEKTFVYFDPPYRPISKTASFTSYAGMQFTDTHQVDLANFYRKLDAEKGAKLMLSNSDPKNENPNDNFFEKIFEGYNFYRVNATRMINCDAEKRGQVKEILITNYKYEPQTLAINF